MALGQPLDIGSRHMPCHEASVMRRLARCLARIGTLRERSAIHAIANGFQQSR